MDDSKPEIEYLLKAIKELEKLQEDPITKNAFNDSAIHNVEIAITTLKARDRYNNDI